MFFVFELTNTRQPQVAGGGEGSETLGQLVKLSSHESFHVFYKNNVCYTIFRRLYRTYFNLLSLKHVPNVNLISIGCASLKKLGIQCHKNSLGSKGYQERA